MKYYQRNEEAIAQENARLEKQASEWGVNVPMLYLLAGTTMVRVLPQYSEKGVFFHQVTKHRVRVNQESTWISACPAAMDNTPCPICQLGQEFMDSKNEMRMDFARQNLRPRSHYLYNVLAHSAPANKKGEVPEFGKVYVMEAGVMVHKQIIALDQDEATGWANITDPERGVALSIRRTGQGLDTRYNVNPCGGGRTNVFSELNSRGIDPNTLTLFDLETVYPVPPEDKLLEVVSKIRVSSFGPVTTAIPTFQPAPPAGTPAVTPNTSVPMTPASAPPQANTIAPPPTTVDAPVGIPTAQEVIASQPVSPPEIPEPPKPVN